MNINRLAAHAASAVLALITMHASAQTAATGYRKLEVGGRVTLEVPLDWKVSDADWREKVAKDGARITLSSVDGDAEGRAAIEHVRESFVIR